MSEFKTNKISPRKGTIQTIGDSGDTVSIPSGVTLSNAGTISGIQKIDWDTTKKTSAFTAVNQTGYFVDTTSAAITVTFPATPSAGSVIGLKDYANTFDTNNLTINPNGNKIQGSTNNFIISVEGTSAQFIYVDATRGWVLTDASKASDIAGVVSFTSATGGTITTCGNDKIHTFTGPGTFTVTSIGNAPVNPLGGPSTVNYLVVGGGGGGGVWGGGGGGGGYRTAGYGPAPLQAPGLSISVTSYPITVGAAGPGQPGPSILTGAPYGGPGNPTTFSSITSAGGGTGYSYCNGANRDGGSGAGNCGTGNTPPVSPPQGSNGGTRGGFPGYGGGGGGGATAVGVNGSPSAGGAGGAGAPNAISGSALSYSGGGGGGGSIPAGSSPGGAGSPCGTGGAGTGNSSGTGTNGTTNRGGGGGSGGYAPGGDGGNGGSGIVVIRYQYQ